MKKNTISRMISIAAAASMLILPGCGSSSAPAAETAAPEATAAETTTMATATDDALQKIIDKGEFILGTDVGDFPPLGFTDENGNEVGFDIDCAEEVCKRLNVKLTVKQIEWDNKENELNSGNIDCIWDGMSKTPERAEAMCLSDAYMNNASVFVIPVDSELSSTDGLNAKTVGVQKGTTSEDILNASGLNITIKPADSIDAALDELDSGNTVAVLMDSVVANYLITSGQRTYMFLPDKFDEEEYVIGFRKGDVSLRNEVQHILHDMKTDGTLAEISTKWFGNDVTVVQ